MMAESHAGHIKSCGIELEREFESHYLISLFIDANIEAQEVTKFVQGHTMSGRAKLELSCLQPRAHSILFLDASKVGP